MNDWTEHEQLGPSDAEQADWYADRYRQARDLCGGEDPVEYIREVQSGKREERRKAEISELNEHLDRAISARQQWRDEAAAMEVKAKNLRSKLDETLALLKEAAGVEADRDSLLDLVQRLLDWSPGGREWGQPDLRGSADRWYAVREEARARMAEMKEKT